MGAAVSPIGELLRALCSNLEPQWLHKAVSEGLVGVVGQPANNIQITDPVLCVLLTEEGRGLREPPFT